MMSLIPLPYKIGALAAGLAVAGLYHWHATDAAYARGVSDTKAAAVIEAGKRIKTMEASNDTFRRLPAHERCVAFMHDSGLPAEHCD